MDIVWIPFLFVAALLAVVFVRNGRVTVLEYERALLFAGGRFKRVVGAGRYWRVGSRLYQKVDVRPTRIAVSGQEVLSADGVAVKASVAATYRVSDAERAVMGSENYQAAIHAELQLALRAIVGGRPIEELLQKRTDIGTQLKEIAGPRLGAIGIELQDAALRDLTFPGELKKTFAQVIKARQEGLAALERARGETAALRNLANAAGMVERNPSLMQLRALQALAQQPGNTLVLGMQPGASPIPLREPGGVRLPPPAADDREPDSEA